MKNLIIGNTYKIGNEQAVFLGLADGVNTFTLEVKTTLAVFYFGTDIEVLNSDNIEMYEELPENLSLVEKEKIEVNNFKFETFVLTANSEIPNSAFCPHGKVDEYFNRKGMIFDETSELNLGDKYRAVFPDYCLIKENNIYRQTDLREDYPDIILELTKFDKLMFLENSKFEDKEKIYLSIKSAESYGGHHKGFLEWKEKVISEFNVFFAEYKLAFFKKIFVIKEDKKEFFQEKLKIQDLTKIKLLWKHQK